MSSKDVKELFLFLVLYFLMHFLKLFLAILLFDCFSSDTKVLLYFTPKIYLMLQLWKSSLFALPLSILQALLIVCPLNFCSIYFCQIYQNIRIGLVCMLKENSKHILQKEFCFFLFFFLFFFAVVNIQVFNIKFGSDAQTGYFTFANDAKTEKDSHFVQL